MILYASNKKLIFTFLIFFITTFSLAAQTCNFEFHKGKAIEMLPEGFLYTHTLPCYNDNNPNKKIRATCLMFKNKNYCIAVSRKDLERDGIVATLYDDKNNVVASTLLSHKNYQKITFQCRQSGLYHIDISFKDKKSYCGCVVVGVQYQYMPKKL
jgi:hypothetical protein